MDIRRYFIFALLGFALLTEAYARAECECPTNSVEEAVRKADRIFQGEVVSAALGEDDSQTIEFVVEVDETIRGTTDKQYSLTTAMPDSCGVGVRLGFRDMFVLGPGEGHVSACTGSGRAPYMKYPLLATAIALVDLPISDVRSAVQLLSMRFYSSYDRATVDEFFELAARIDPTGNTATALDDRIEYRAIVVYFKDGKYDKVGVL